jgi:hypothetical protein
VQSGWGSIELGADSGDRANCIGGKFAAARGSRRRGVGGGGGGGGGRRRRRGVGRRVGGESAYIGRLRDSRAYWTVEIVGRQNKQRQPTP